MLWAAGGSLYDDFPVIAHVFVFGGGNPTRSSSLVVFKAANSEGR